MRLVCIFVAHCCATHTAGSPTTPSANSVCTKWQCVFALVSVCAFWGVACEVKRERVHLCKVACQCLRWCEPPLTVAMLTGVKFSGALCAQLTYAHTKRANALATAFTVNAANCIAGWLRPVYIAMLSLLAGCCYRCKLAIASAAKCFCKDHAARWPAPPPPQCVC